MGHQFARNWVLQPMWGNDTKATDSHTRAGEQTMDVLDIAGEAIGLASMATMVGIGRAVSPLGMLFVLHNAAEAVSAGMNLLGHAKPSEQPKNPL